MDLSKHIEPGQARNTFLSAKDVGKGMTVKILDVREAPRQMKFSDIIVCVSDGHKTYDWGQKFASVNVRAVCELFGTNTDKWKGKKLKLVTVPWFNNRTRKKQQIINVASGGK